MGRGIKWKKIKSKTITNNKLNDGWNKGMIENPFGMLFTNSKASNKEGKKN